MTCENNTAMECNCTFSCSRHGKCCECIAHHNGNGQFPACFYSKAAEKTGDRSLEALIKDRKV